jgi:transcriptional regulator with XRE-family HTH domain
MQRIPPQVTLRAIREAHGLTSVTLAAKIAERGVKVDPDSLLSVELGHKRASNALLVAWAGVLQINPRDIRQAAELRELVGEAENDAASDAA